MTRFGEPEKNARITTTMKKAYLLGMLVLAAAISGARADVIPTNGAITAEAGGFRWNYSTNVTVDQVVKPGDYFTIYDFGQLRTGSNIQPANWAFSSSLIGTTPGTVLPQDDPNVFNLTWTYTGTAPIAGQSLLGLFSVVSDTDQMRSDNFAAHATRASGPQAGTKIDNIGTVGVPVPEMSALAPVIGICGIAAAGFFSSALRRRRRSD